MRLFLVVINGVLNCCSFSGESFRGKGSYEWYAEWFSKCLPACEELSIGLSRVTMNRMDMTYYAEWLHSVVSSLKEKIAFRLLLMNFFEIS